jgi:hypothetical protein
LCYFHEYIYKMYFCNIPHPLSLYPFPFLSPAGSLSPVMLLFFLGLDSTWVKTCNIYLSKLGLSQLTWCSPVWTGNSWWLKTCWIYLI